MICTCFAVQPRRVSKQCRSVTVRKTVSFCKKSAGERRGNFNGYRGKAILKAESHDNENDKDDCFFVRQMHKFKKVFILSKAETPHGYQGRIIPKRRQDTTMMEIHPLSLDVRRRQQFLLIISVEGSDGFFSLLVKLQAPFGVLSSMPSISRSETSTPAASASRLSWW
jgi:hypothetical protein